MLGEARLAQDLASRLFDDGVYVTGFFYPVVPQGKARIRTQMSAGLSPGDIDRAVAAFTRAGKAMQII
jgi:glycine C-acetyltransferase